VISRRTLLRILAVGSLAPPPSAEAQRSGKIYRVGVLHPAVRQPEGWLKNLRDLGYVEGENLVIESRYAEGKPERLPALAAELVRLPVDVIVATAGDAILAAKNATLTIPIVMAFGASPVERGLVKSLARPGGNVTGVAYAAEGILMPKRLQLLKEVVPKAKRIGMLSDGLPSFQVGLDEAKSVARILDVELVVVDARRGRYEEAFAQMTAQRADALHGGGSPIHNRDRTQILALAARHRLPAIWEWRAHAEEGGLLSYGASIAALQRSVATYIDRILRGAKPADLPVEQPTKFELVINLKTAKALGLTISQSVLARADQIIE
jgi:putative ABC transport system substrate-binding protein